MIYSAELSNPGNGLASGYDQAIPSVLIGVITRSQLGFPGQSSGQDQDTPSEHGARSTCPGNPDWARIVILSGLIERPIRTRGRRTDWAFNQDFQDNPAVSLFASWCAFNQDHQCDLSRPECPDFARVRTQSASWPRRHGNPEFAHNRVACLVS